MIEITFLTVLAAYLIVGLIISITIYATLRMADFEFTHSKFLSKRYEYIIHKKNFKFDIVTIIMLCLGTVFWIFFMPLAILRIYKINKIINDRILNM